MLTLLLAQAAALTLGEVEAAAKTGAVLPLAQRVLPPDVAARVIEGKARQQWLPGQSYWLAFVEAPRAIAADLCEREVHAVVAAAPNAATDDAPADTKLAVEPERRWTEAAVLFPGATGCTGAHFVSVQQDRARQIAAYRVLVAAIAAARARSALPFRIACRAESPAACADVRSALATLPMDALFAVEVQCLDSERSRRAVSPGVWQVTCPPAVAGRPYQAEVRFGMSGPDGQSWTVSFTHRPGWPEQVSLQRSTVVYH